LSWRSSLKEQPLQVTPQRRLEVLLKNLWHNGSGQPQQQHKQQQGDHNAIKNVTDNRLDRSNGHLGGVPFEIGCNFLCSFINIPDFAKQPVCDLLVIREKRRFCFSKNTLSLLEGKQIPINEHSGAYPTGVQILSFSLAKPAVFWHGRRIRI